MGDTAVDMEVMVDTVLDTAMVDTVATEDTVDTVDTDMEVMVDTDMVDTVEREKPKLPQKLMPKLGTETLDTDTVPDTVLELTDTVPDTVPDTDSAMLDTVPDTVSDMAMVDTVERDPLMPTTDAVTVMVVMVDTAVDTVDTDTDVDTDTRFLSNQLTKETILYKIMPL